MNLADVIEYDRATRYYRINPEKAQRVCERRTSCAVAEVSVREHRRSEEDERQVDLRERRPLRKAGLEVVKALKCAGRRLNVTKLSALLPEVPMRKLQRQLTEMVDRGDIQRHGDRGQRNQHTDLVSGYLYAMPTSSTLASTW